MRLVRQCKLLLRGLSSQKLYPLAIVVGAMAGSGCMTSHLESQFARTTGCPKGRVQVELMEDDLVRATGCGQMDILAGYATGNQGQFSSYVSGLERAGHDLGCPVNQVRLRYLGGRAVGAVGCGRNMTLLQDPTHGWRVEGRR